MQTKSKLYANFHDLFGLLSSPNQCFIMRQYSEPAFKAAFQAKLSANPGTVHFFLLPGATMGLEVRKQPSLYRGHRHLGQLAATGIPT